MSFERQYEGLITLLCDECEAECLETECNNIGNAHTYARTQEWKIVSRTIPGTRTVEYWKHYCPPCKRGRYREIAESIRRGRHKQV